MSIFTCNNISSYSLSIEVVGNKFPEMLDYFSLVNGEPLMKLDKILLEH